MYIDYRQAYEGIPKWILISSIPFVVISQAIYTVIQYVNFRNK